MIQNHTLFAQEDTMSIEENKAIVRRHFEQFCNRGHCAAANEMYTADYIHHNLLTPHAPLSPQHEQDPVVMLRIALPDLRITIDSMMVKGEEVVVRWRITGTDKGGLGGAPPTGNQVMIMGTSTFRVDDGKIVKDWLQLDLLRILQQIQGSIKMRQRESCER
jgi:predicted ester cyclase